MPKFRKLFLHPKIVFRILELFRLTELELKGSKMGREGILYLNYRAGGNFETENRRKRPFLGSFEILTAPSMPALDMGS